MTPGPSWPSCFIYEANKRQSRILFNSKWMDKMSIIERITVGWSFASIAHEWIIFYLVIVLPFSIHQKIWLENKSISKRLIKVWLKIEHHLYEKENIVGNGENVGFKDFFFFWQFLFRRSNSGLFDSVNYIIVKPSFVFMTLTAIWQKSLVKIPLLKDLFGVLRHINSISVI